MKIPKKETPFVSIIVPTLNREMHLRNCLDSLFKLDYPRSKFEVIVVDNGSTDGTMEMVYREFPEVKLVFEKRKSSCFARNAGWKNAKGQIVAYTDDDCVVDPCWLRILVSSFTSAGIGGVGGPLLLLLRPESIVRKFHGTPVGNFYKGEEKILVKELITANLAVRREVFKKNRFDVSLPYTDLEDIDFCRSLIEAGYKLLYIPDAKVYHNIDPKRLTTPYILKRAFFAGISLYIFERKRSEKIVLIPKFLRKTVGGFLLFFVRRRVADFFWLVKCFIAFLASILLISTLAFDVKNTKSNRQPNPQSFHPC